MKDTAGWDFFDTKVWEERDEGLLDVESAGGLDDEVEIIRWASPRSRRYVSFVVASRGGPPDIPAVRSLSGGYVPLYERVGAAFPMPTEGAGAAGVLWVVFGDYAYAMRKGRPVDSDFPLGLMPGAENKLGNVVVNGIPAASFLRSMLDNRQVATLPLLAPGITATP